MSTDSSSSDSQVQRIIDEFAKQLQGTNPETADQFITRYPELAQSLAVELRRAEMFLNIRENIDQQLANPTARKLRVICPECRSSVELEPESSWSSIRCSSCNTNFSLIHDDHDMGPDIEKIAHFNLLERVGMGSFGTVWKAYDNELDRVAAIKMPRKGQLTALEIEHFLREARAAAQINHPNIVKVFEVGRIDENVFIASEFVEGQSLAQRLAVADYSIRDSAIIVHKLAKALHCAHQVGVVHRDLKPGNILIDNQGEPHIADFGLAKRDAGDITMTTTGAVMGTPAFMAPEQAKGLAHQSDARSDIYSLGVVLFRLITGELPFRGSTAALLQQVIHDDPPQPRKFNDRIPRDLETICLKCLEKQPDRRFSNAAELADEMQRFIDNKPIVSRPISVTERVWRWCKRQPALTGALGLALTIFVAGTITSTILSVEAARESQKARAATETANRRIYAADMIRVQQAFERDKPVQALGLLRKHIPQPGESDLRQMEWHYWWRKCSRGIQGVYSGQNRFIAVAVAPDGETVVWGDDQGAIYVSDIGFDNVQKLPNGHTDRVSDISFSTKGEYFVTGGHDGTVLVWSTRGLEPVNRKSFSPGRIWHVGYWTEKDHLVVGLETQRQKNDGQTQQVAKQVEVRVFTSDWDEEIDHYRTTGHYPWLALSPDGRKVAIGDSAIGQEFVLRDVVAGENRWVQQTEKNFFGRSIFSPSGKELLVCYWDWQSTNREKFQIYNAETGNLKREGLRQPGTSGISQLAYSNDDSYLLLGTGKGGIDIYDASSLDWITTLSGHANRVSDLAVSATDGQIVSVGDDQTTRRWGLDLTSNPMVLKVSRFSNDLALGDEAGLFAISDRELLRWQIDDSKARTSSNHHGRNVALSPDHREVYFIQRVADTTPGSFRYVLFRCDQQLGAVTLVCEFDRPFSTVECLPDGNLVLCEVHSTQFSLDCPAALAVYSLKQRKIIREFGGDSNPDTHHMSVSGWALSPDSQWLASCSRDRTVKLWNFETGEMVYSRKRENTINPIYTLDVSVDGVLATGEADGMIILRDLVSGEQLSEIFAHDKGVSFLQFTRDGKTIVSGSADSTIKFWDASSGQLRTELSGGGSPFTAFALAPQESHLAASDEGGHVSVWNLTPVEVQANDFD